MKALTLHQPWASAVALGLKTVETRSWRTSYRGPLAIHASRRSDVPVPAGMWVHMAMAHGPEWSAADLPLGAIVATCRLVDVVPILAADDELAEAWAPHVAPIHSGELWLWLGPSDTENLSTGRPTWRHRVIEDQRPWGDYTPGRWAWLLDDVKPTTERCPACWGARPFAVSDADMDAPDGAEGIEVEDFAGWRFSRVGLEWMPDACHVCAFVGACDPVPARGRQGLWEWTP